MWTRWGGWRRLSTGSQRPDLPLPGSHPFLNQPSISPLSAHCAPTRFSRRAGAFYSSPPYVCLSQTRRPVFWYPVAKAELRGGKFSWQGLEQSSESALLWTPASVWPAAAASRSAPCPRSPFPAASRPRRTRRSVWAAAGASANVRPRSSC